MARITHESTLSNIELEKLLNSILNDMTTIKDAYNTLRADLSEVRTKLIATHAKLDLDGGVTDTDYASSNDPAALTSSDVGSLETTT